MALENWYSTGTVSVESGSTTVTLSGGFWGGDAIMAGDFLVIPSISSDQIAVASVTSDTELELLWAWPHADAEDAPYFIFYTGIIERSTAQTRKVLEQLGDVKAWYDVIVEDDDDRLALETEGNPLRAWYRVLVRDDGVIWAKATSAYGDWIGPVELKGDTGDKGWSPVYGLVEDGERRVEQLIEWVGGEGIAPTASVGKYRGAAGLVDDIEDATDVRGPAGDIDGVTPFWQERITGDTDPGAALTGLGFSTFVKTLVDASSADAVREVLEVPAAAATDMFRGFRYALNGTDPLHYLDIYQGICRDSTNLHTIDLASTLTKRADTSWGPGVNSGLIDGTPASGFYWLHVIYNPATGVVDAIGSQSINAPSLPSGFVSRRVIGGFALLTGLTINPFINDGEWHRYVNRAPSVVNAANSAPLFGIYRTLAAPLGAKLEFELYMSANATSGGSAGAVTVRDPDLGTFASDGNALVNHADWYYAANAFTFGKIRVFSDNLARVMTGDNNANGVITLRTEAWRLDRRVYL